MDTFEYILMGNNAKYLAVFLESPVVKTWWSWLTFLT